MIVGVLHLKKSWPWCVCYASLIFISFQAGREQACPIELIAAAMGTRMLREKIMTLKESVHCLLRDAIKDSLTTPTPPLPVDL